MVILGLTPESRELDDLSGDKSLPAEEESLNHEWLKPAFEKEATFYASHTITTKIIKTIAMILGCSSMVSKEITQHLSCDQVILDLLLLSTLWI